MLVEQKVSYLGPREELRCAICSKPIVDGEDGIQVIMGRVVYDRVSQEMVLTYETDSITHRDCKLLNWKPKNANDVR